MNPKNHRPTALKRIPRSRPLSRRPSHALTLAFLSAFLVAHQIRLPAQDADALQQSLIEDLQAALFEEEVNQDLDAAIEGYTSLVNRIDQQRALAATALYRLGECYRKRGDNDDAAQIYERVLTDFSDQEKAVAVSAQNLRAINPQSPALAAHDPGPNATPQSPTNGLPQDPETLKKLLESYKEELELIAVEIQDAQIRIRTGQAGPIALNAPKRAQLEIMRQIALVEGALKSADPSPQSNLTNDEAEALKLAKRIVQESPDLLQATDTANPIYEPALAGHSTVVEYLLEQGAFSNPNELIARVAATGNLKMTLALANALPQDSDRAKIFGEALIAPIDKGYTTIVSELLRLGANPNVIVTPGSHGYSVKAKSTEAFSLLTFAAAAGTVEMLEILLEWDADINMTVPQSRDKVRTTALTAGVKNPEVTQFLINRGANTELPEDHSKRPLFQAIAQGQAETATILLRAGAKINPSTDPKFDPLALSIVRSNNHPALTDVTQQLIQSGAEVSLTDEHGNTPLTKLIDRRSPDPSSTDIQIAAAIIDEGFDLNDPSREIPLHRAADKGSTKWVEFLLQNDADPNLRDSQGVSAISRAANALARDSSGRPIPAAGPRTSRTASRRASRSATSGECIYLLRNAGAILEPNEKAEILLETNAADDGSQQVFKEILQTPPLDIPASDPQLSEQLLNDATKPELVPNLRALCESNVNLNVIYSKHDPSGTPLERANQIIQELEKRNEFREAQKWKEVAAVLIEHGADPYYTRKNSIQLRRDDETIVYAQKFFDGQSHSLIDILTDVCDPSGCQTYQFDDPDQRNIDKKFQTPFPDLRRILIHRIGPDSEMTTETVDVVAALNRGTDIQAQWGDIIEIPELPHPVGEFWPGLPRELQNVLIEKTARTFTLNRHGETFPVRAETRMQTSEKDGLVTKTFFYQLQDDPTSFASLTEEQQLELLRYQIILRQATEAVEEGIRTHNEALESDHLARRTKEDPTVQEFRSKIGSMSEILKELKNSQLELQTFISKGDTATPRVESQFDYKDTSIYRALIEALDTRVELAGYRTKYGENHPTIAEGTVLFESNKKDLRELLAKNTGTRTFIDFVDGPNEGKANQINIVVDDPHDFSLKSLLVEGQLLLSNSDTSNIKVTRPQSDDDAPQTWDTDIDGVIASNLVIQDGDIVEIQER